MPVEQYNALRKMLDEFSRLITERGRCHEDALRRPKADKAPHKRLHLRATDRSSLGVALGLNVNAVEPESIFIDDAIDAPVSSLTKLGRRVLS